MGSTRKGNRGEGVLGITGGPCHSASKGVSAPSCHGKVSTQVQGWGNTSCCPGPGEHAKGPLETENGSATWQLLVEPKVCRHHRDDAHPLQGCPREALACTQIV